MAAKISSTCRVALLVAAACAIASAYPFQPLESHQYTEQEQQEHGDVSQPAEHGDDGDHHKPGSTYHFQYAVHDPVTGDEKSQNEVGDGHGSVKGTYSLVEPDGSTRVVEYTADDVHGFRAEVKRIEPKAKAAHSHEPSAPAHKSDFAAESHAPPAVDYELLQHYYSQHQPELHSSTHR